MNLSYLSFRKWISIAFIFQHINTVDSQALRIPNTTNITCSAGRKLGVTDINIHWNAPGVKGREGKIWGTDIAYFGTIVHGFGSNMKSPWRAGSDECTTISFSTDVTINGQSLKAGKYAFFIELGLEESTLIFNSNADSWGSYFYEESKDVLRVKTKQQKDTKNLKERLEFTFTDQTTSSVELALEWEYWRIPFTVEIDLKTTFLASIQSQMRGHLGFDPLSLVSAANWCLQNDINYDQALEWINSATNPNLGGIKNFQSLSVKAGLLKKIGNNNESDLIMNLAIENANSMELHIYGRKLLSENKLNEAFKVFQKNYLKNNGEWPTKVGMMRIYSAMGNLQKALEYGKEALKQAPDNINKRTLEIAIQTLESGKAL